jgi:hypothetical protein
MPLHSSTKPDEGHSTDEWEIPGQDNALWYWVSVFEVHTEGCPELDTNDFHAQGYFYKAASMSTELLTVADTAEVVIQAHVAQTLGTRLLFFFPVTVCVRITDLFILTGRPLRSDKAESPTGSTQVSGTTHFNSKADS